MCRCRALPTTRSSTWPGVEMESDMNKYDVVHVTTAHASMSNEELLSIYRLTPIPLFLLIMMLSRSC
jgi:hypothetical protein